MKVQDKIEALLNSNMSQYAISKATGVTQSKISELKNGKRDINNLTLEVADKLAKFYDASMIDLVTKGDELASQYKPVMQAQFQEVLDSQLELAKSSEGTKEDVRALRVMEVLFDMALQDNGMVAVLLPYFLKD
ncbi:XRE family transcriptional regulator [Weissella hellenica]|nr:XRE family transcriptional regulator [Weissella hellenica]